MNNNSNSINNYNQNSGICINNNINNAYNNNLNMNTFNIINNNNYVGTNTVSLIDCFEYDQKVNHMTGENQMYCNACRKNTDCDMRTILTEGPEVLILLLNRGKGIEFDIKIQFWESIDLSQFFTHEKNCNYDLIGVITHFGESSMSGHFIAYCRDPLNKNNWIKYNDSIVSDVEPNNFQKEVIDFGMPYLLFYQKSK
jgi:ubiquitin C-terminal hydrolase